MTSKKENKFNTPSSKVFRVNGHRTKGYKNPEDRKSAELSSQSLGLSFDAYQSRFQDSMVEELLESDSHQKIKSEIPKRDQLSVMTCYEYLKQDGSAGYRVYRFLHEARWPGTEYAYNKGMKLDARIRVPKAVFEAIQEIKASEFEFSLRALLDGLFRNLLKTNNIGIPTTKYEAGPKYFAQLKESLDRIAQIDCWTPYGLYTPVYYHEMNKEELENKFQCYRFVGENCPLAYETMEVRFLFGDKIVNTLGSDSTIKKFHPLRDLLPYVEQRFWRNHHQLFSLLFFQFLIENELFDLPTATVNDDFSNRLIKLTENLK